MTQLLSEDFKILVETRYVFVVCFTILCRKKGVALSADFLKLQFKDLLSPPGIPISVLRSHSYGVRYLWGEMLRCN